MAEVDRAQLGGGEVGRPDADAGRDAKVGVVADHRDAVGGDVHVRLDVRHADGERLARTASSVFSGAVDREPAVREHPRGSGGEVPVAGCADPYFAGRLATPAKNPSLMPLRASVNSLGMIQSLFDSPSAIFGSVCRYW